MGEIHGKNVASSFPRTVFGSWYFAMPFEHIGGSIVVFCWFCYKAEGMIASPLFPFFFESIDN